MKIAVTSDLHGRLPHVPECDVLAICGDICPLRDVDGQMHWLDGAFRKWLFTVPAKHGVVVIAGNHDWPMYLKASGVRELGLPWIYLQDSSVEICGVKFYGSPWSLEFCGWAFMDDEHALMGKYNKIPEDTDVLLSHCPPKGCGDLTVDGVSIGSLSLARRIQQLQLKAAFFGHNHKPWVGHAGKTVLANVAYVDDDYKVGNSVQVFEI